MIGRMLQPPMMRKQMDTFFEKHPELKGVYPCDDFRDGKSVALEDAIHRLTEHVASIGCELRRLRYPVEPDMQTVEQCPVENDTITYRELIQKYNFRGVKSAKDPKWRKANGFDVCVSQSWKGCSVVFVVSRVDEWLSNREKKSKQKVKARC